MPTSPKVPAIGDEADFPPLPPASPSPAPAELSAEAKLLVQIAEQQIASEKRIELILEQHKLQQTVLESRLTLLERENVILKETVARRLSAAGLTHPASAFFAHPCLKKHAGFTSFSVFFIKNASLAFPSQCHARLARVRACV
jgi:hypothetical protein